MRTMGKQHMVWDGREIIPAFPAGRLELGGSRSRNLVAVGDRVLLRTQPDGTALIEGVLPRTNKISRRLTFSGVEHVVASNVDVMAVMLSAWPGPNTGLLDRYLVEAHASDVAPLILVNKMDLPGAGGVNDVMRPYAEMGYPIYAMSARTGDGVGDFVKAAAGKWVVVVGHSGVGKTTLLNTVSPSEARAVGEVNPATGKGRHTTTSGVAHRLENGGVLVDTAGIRGFALWGMDWRCVESGFLEIHEAGSGCRYPDCRHRGEPGCAVSEALSRGEITERRFESYLILLDEAESVA